MEFNFILKMLEKVGMFYQNKKIELQNDLGRVNEKNSFYYNGDFFVVIDGYTALLVLGDLITTTTTIEVINQSEDIVAKVKEHFNINYEITKIQYSLGFPDGYGLEIYDSGGAKEHFFEDDGFEDSEIDAYFQKLNIDTPKYLKVLIIEIILGIILIIVIIRRNRINEQ